MAFRTNTVTTAASFQSGNSSGISSAIDTLFKEKYSSFDSAFSKEFKGSITTLYGKVSAVRLISTDESNDAQSSSSSSASSSCAAHSSAMISHTMKALTNEIVQHRLLLGKQNEQVALLNAQIVSLTDELKRAQTPTCTHETANVNARVPMGTREHATVNVPMGTHAPAPLEISRVPMGTHGTTSQILVDCMSDSHLISRLQSMKFPTLNIDTAISIYNHGHPTMFPCAIEKWPSAALKYRPFARNLSLIRNSVQLFNNTPEAERESKFYDVDVNKQRKPKSLDKIYKLFLNGSTS